jgi:hypothetical protein
MSDKFTFGASSVMREVPPGQTAVIKFNGKAEKVETDWGDKFSYKILIFSHPSYDSIPKEGIESTWQSKSQAAENLMTALSSGIKNLTKSFEEDKWELIRSQEGVYFLQQL